MATKRIDRSKRTKAQLEEEIGELEEKLANTAPADPTAQAIAKERSTALREQVKGFSIDNIVQQGAKFGLELQRTLTGLTEQVVQKVGELSALQETIDIETKEIERLYGIDVASASIKGLIEEHKEKVEELHAEIEETRAAWSEEQSDFTKKIAQRNQDVEAGRKREQAEYDYKTKQERTRSEEEFRYKLQIAERDQKEREEQATRTIEARFADLRAQELLLAEGRLRIEGLDAEVKQKVEAAVAIATNSLKATLNNQFTIEKKDLEVVNRLETQKVASLAEQLSRANAEIAKLQGQLDAARTEVRDIAAKAVEGAAGQLALKSVMEVRQENGSGQRKS